MSVALAAAPDAAAACAGGTDQNFGESFNLRVAAFCVIFVCSSAGVVIPAALHLRPSMSNAMRGGWLFVAKAFGAGVILAVGLIHVMPDAANALSDPCLGWPSYPFAGMIATLAAIAVLVLEGCITAIFERVNTAPTLPLQAPSDLEMSRTSKELTTAYVHGHGHNQEASDNPKVEKVRHLTIAQVLEAGIAIHSVLIGVTIGVASNLGVVRSLLAAITFHQFFEGIALGACFMEAAISRWSYVVMGAIFALSTPLGVAIGLGVQATYSDHSPISLGVQGVFDSVSAGILIYMALVDLIAVDFVEAKRPLRAKVVGYAALFFGAFCMGLLAIWA
ncbi:hypothetical protein WJX81_004195 [Elliptochloris bilobata]|uniref:Uncharacterized protein n=1 Tax=Elliptochloris bilobata TaxID=381761 RepID=A0AAW1QBU1_9CHLO